MNSNRVNFFVTIFMVFSIAGCVPPRYYSTPEDNVYLLADYRDAIQTWISHDELHHQMLGIADLNAVYRSWEVRQAYMELVRLQISHEPALIEQVRQRECEGYNRGHEFLIGLYCYDKEWERLTGLDPIWRVTLYSDTGVRVKPIFLEKVEVHSEEGWLYLDEITHGRTVYRVVFPKQDQNGCELINEKTRMFHLTCDSVIGNLDLKWRLKPIPKTLY